MQVTVVVPLYNEAATLETLAGGIARNLAGRDYRIIFVDDGSTDGGFDILRRLCEADTHIAAIRLTRNFGKGAALAVGFAHAPDGIVVTMDADLQDDPDELPRMIAAIEGGLDLVCGWKRDRNDPWHKTMPSRVFNAWMRRKFRLTVHDVNTGYKAMRSEVARRLPTQHGLYRMLPAFAQHFGYRVGEVPVKHHPRRHGKSKYGFNRVFHGYVDAHTTAYLVKRGSHPARRFYVRALACVCACFYLGLLVLRVMPVPGSVVLEVLAGFLDAALVAGMLGFAMLATICIRAARRAAHTIRPSRHGDSEYFVAETIGI